MMETAVPSEMFVTLYSTTWGNIAEGKKLQTFVLILLLIFMAELVSYPEPSEHGSCKPVMVI
jgi:hypothetical protein